MTVEELVARAEWTRDRREAAVLYRQVLALDPVEASSYGAELALAEVTADAAEARALLDAVVATGLSLGHERFRYALARARWASDPDEAAAYARGALWLATHDTPVSNRHPTVGLIRAKRKVLRELAGIAEAGEPEAFNPLVERFRARDGEVRWEWSLTSRLHEPPGEDRFAGLIADLRAAGLEVLDFWDWAQGDNLRAAAIPILLEWLDRSEDGEVRRAIAVALNDRRARKRATGPLIGHFRVEQNLEVRHAMAEALATLARDEHFDELAELIRDPAYGHHRYYLMAAVGYMKRREAVELAREFADDDEEALRNWARVALERLSRGTSQGSSGRATD